MSATFEANPSSRISLDKLNLYFIQGTKNRGGKHQSFRFTTVLKTVWIWTGCLFYLTVGKCDGIQMDLSPRKRKETKNSTFYFFEFFYLTFYTFFSQLRAGVSVSSQWECWCRPWTCVVSDSNGWIGSMDRTISRVEIRTCEEQAAIPRPVYHWYRQHPLAVHWRRTKRQRLHRTPCWAWQRSYTSKVRF